MDKLLDLEMSEFTVNSCLRKNYARSQNSEKLKSIKLRITGLCSKGTSISDPGSQLRPANPPAPPFASSFKALVMPNFLKLDDTGLLNF